MAEETLVELARKALADEVFSTKFYTYLSRLYRGGSTRSMLERVAVMEKGHAEYWLTFLERRGFDASSVRVGRFRLVAYMALARLLGMGLTLRVLEAGERGAVELYSKMLESPQLNGREKRGLRKIVEDELVHEQEFAEEESRFEELLTHVRDAVLGMNDGLVEVLSVTTGLAGAYGNPFHVALGGLIVGVAGAFSMGVGSFASVRAQRQVHEGVLRRISLASRHATHLFKDRITGYMAKKGFGGKVSESVAEESSKDHGLLSRLIAEEEYGLREEALEDPSKAGLYTGSFYMLGAFVPLIPYFLDLPIVIAILSSLLLAATALAFTGFMIAVSANLAIRKKMLEMVIAGLGSAAATFVIGRAASMLLGIELE